MGKQQSTAEGLPDFEDERAKSFKAGGKDIVPEEYVSITTIDKYLVDLLGEEPFFASISMNMPKVMTRSIPTMGVTWRNDTFTLLINPDFVDRLKSAGRHAEVHSVLIHEFYHPIFGHLTFRKVDEQRPTLRNWVCDLAINSIIVHSQKRPLPSSPLVPGLRPGMPLDPKKDPIGPELAAHLAKPPSKVDLAVMNAKSMQSSEYYHSLLSKVWTDEDEKSGGGAGTDDHDVWEMPEGVDPNYVKEKAKTMLERAVTAAEAKNWGSVPAEIQERFHELLTPTIDWREELRQWTGNQYQSNDKVHTHRKINRKFPYIHPGVKRGRGIRAALCVDQSGSVSDQLLQLLSGEIRGMGEVASVTVIPFDCSVDKGNIKSFESGDLATFARTRSGGTDFNAPTRYVNDEARRDEFDIMWILTDGECSAPDASRVPRCWIIGPQNHLAFPTDEKVIQIKG